MLKNLFSHFYSSESYYCSETSNHVDDLFEQLDEYLHIHRIAILILINLCQSVRYTDDNHR